MAYTREINVILESRVRKASAISFAACRSSGVDFVSVVDTSGADPNLYFRTGLAGVLTPKELDLLVKDEPPLISRSKRLDEVSGLMRSRHDVVRRERPKQRKNNSLVNSMMLQTGQALAARVVYSAQG